MCGDVGVGRGGGCNSITMWFYSYTSALDIFEVQNAVCHVESDVLIGTKDFKLRTIPPLLMTVKQLAFVF